MRRWRDAEGALAAARAEIDTAARDREWLEHAVAELRALAPEPGEEETLADRRRTMQRAEKIADDLRAIDDLARRVATAGWRSCARRRACSNAIADDHAALAEALAAIDRAVIEGAVAEERLREAHAPRCAFDPRALEDDEARLFELRAMARKHRVQPDDLAALADELAATARSGSSAGEEGIAALEAKVATARDGL